ncbi:MAG: hypothetical protein ACJ73D_05560 [Pyrinomonadaceae bacterium]
MQNLEQGKQNATNFDPSLVNGWGVDADPVNDPTYPMKAHTRIEHDGYSWDRPAQQEPEVEVLHSSERPNLAATFGETIPPAGLSGMIRRAAFTFSENSYGHWLPLMLADRVQMVEGVVVDLAKGQLPNLWKELGYSAEWKYNRKGLVTKLAIMGGVAVGIGLLLMRRRGDGDS